VVALQREDFSLELNGIGMHFFYHSNFCAKNERKITKNKAEIFFGLITSDYKKFFPFFVILQKNSCLTQVLTA